MDSEFRQSNWSFPPIKKTNASNERVLHLILELHNIIAILISFGLIFLRSLVDWEILVVHARRCVCFCVLCRVEKVLSPSHILINFGFKEQGQKLKDHPLISSFTAICLLIQYTWGLFLTNFLANITSECGSFRSPNREYRICCC